MEMGSLAESQTGKAQSETSDCQLHLYAFSLIKLHNFTCTLLSHIHVEMCFADFYCVMQTEFCQQLSQKICYFQSNIV